MSKNISIIIPTLNEEGNIATLVKRIVRSFSDNGLIGEIVFVDDNSIDKTRKVIAKIKKEYENVFPIRLFLKKGRIGKAFSIIEGFDYANFEIIAIIDADLQYPPEAIAKMAKGISSEIDIIVANRDNLDVTFFRSLLFKACNHLFARFLHNLNCDVQSGLKVFRKKIIKQVILDPSPWTFDMEFLLSAQNYGYKIGTVKIKFNPRFSGKSKLKFFKAIFEIIWSAIKLKIKGYPPLLINPEPNKHMQGAGVVHKKKHFITHTTLHHYFSALDTFVLWQKVFIAIMVVLFLAGLLLNPLLTGIIFISFISILYFIDVIFNFFLVMKSLITPPEIFSSREEMLAIDDSSLPLYSIFCPLYKESQVLPHFVAAIEKMEWPKNKLEVLLLLEENDQETIDVARNMNLPDYVKVVVVPHSLPKTKPKACNYGITYAHGEYIVIYDAEDIPDPWQLKKAYLGFKKSPPNVLCLQAKLNYFNPNQNILTRLFTAEYSLWFDVSLPGLQSINTSIPLGGTSNHFRRQDLVDLRGWDPFNVTEDCDLGVRLFVKGFRTAIIDSVTLEEANSNFKNWLRQRSRWIKGYMQTYLVHMRNPFNFLKKNGWHAVIFQLVVGGKIAFMLINPLLWITTIAYFTLTEYVGETIRSLFPIWIFYIAVVSLVFGNFLFVYYYMIGCAKRNHYQLIKYVFFVPIYWIMVSMAAVIAIYQLFVKPHYWEKTHHGLHLLPAKNRERLMQLWETFQNSKVYRILAKIAIVLGPVLYVINIIKKLNLPKYLVLIRDRVVDLNKRLVRVVTILKIKRLKFTSRKITQINIAEPINLAVEKVDTSLENNPAVSPGKEGANANYQKIKLFRYLYFKNIKIKLAALKLHRLRRLKFMLKKFDLLGAFTLENFKISNFGKKIKSKVNSISNEKTKFILEEIISFSFSNKGLLLAAVIISNVLNFLFNAFLARKLSYPDLALVILMTTFWYVITIFTSGSSSSINHKVAFLTARQDSGVASSFLRKTLLSGSRISILVIIILILLSQVLANFFRVDSYLIFALFSPAILFGFLASSLGGFLSGNLLFGRAAIVLLVESIMKLWLAILFVYLNRGDLVYLSIPLSLIVAALVGGYFVYRVPKIQKTKNNITKVNFPFNFFLSSIMASLSYIIFLSVDIVLVKHFFEQEVAGQYSIISLVGKMVYFLGTLPLIFLITLVSHKEGLNQSSKNIFYVTFTSVFALTALGVIAFGFLGFYTISILFGEKSLSIIKWLPAYCMAVGIFALSNSIVTYHLAKKQYIFTYISVGASFVLAAAIWFFHKDIYSVINLFLVVSLLNFFVLGILHFLERHIPFFGRSVGDFWDIFSGKLPKATPEVITGKKILIFNWRDTMHSFAGGAENYIHQIAKNWIKQGNHVTIFCGNDGKQKRYDLIDGVHIVRRGGFYLVYFWAFLYYIFRFRGKYDLIIDCENGIPFFTPLYVRKPIYAILHHVHQNIFFHSLPKPLALLASSLEKDLMPLVYKNIKFITVSESSKKEMEKLGIGKAGIKIVHNGVNLNEFVLGSKSDNPTILYLGRLKAYKSVDILIRAFKKVIKKYSQAILIIAGTGDAEKYLKNLSAELGFNEKQIIFMGKVSEEEKIKLLQSAWVMVNPSFMEGWGVVVIEANACGTPVIASNVSGLCDSVSDRKSGYLVPYGNVDSFADKILYIIENKEYRGKMNLEARTWAENFNWEKSSAEFLEFIENKNTENLLVDEKQIYEEN